VRYLYCAIWFTFYIGSPTWPSLFLITLQTLLRDTDLPLHPVYNHTLVLVVVFLGYGVALGFFRMVVVVVTFMTRY